MGIVDRMVKQAKICNVTVGETSPKMSTWRTRNKLDSRDIEYVKTA